MYDYKTIPSDEELTVTFEPDLLTPNALVAKSKEDQSEVGSVVVEGGTFTASSDEIFMQYKLWQTLPERAIGKLVKTEGQNLMELMDSYEELLIGAFRLNRSGKGYTSMIDWLRTTDFYTCPASTIYHEAYPGGLLIHTLRVYNLAMSLSNSPMFASCNKADIAIAALTHDWCKIGLYESYEKNVKNEQTGQWEKKPAYRRNQKGVPLGHGATSMFLATRFFNLNAETACAIRWHMARFNVCEPEINEFQLANETYPLVHLMQFADQLSITTYAAADLKEK